MCVCICVCAACVFILELILVCTGARGRVSISRISEIKTDFFMIQSIAETLKVSVVVI